MPRDTVGPSPGREKEQEAGMQVEVTRAPRELRVEAWCMVANYGCECTELRSLTDGGDETRLELAGAVQDMTRVLASFASLDFLVTSIESTLRSKTISSLPFQRRGVKMCKPITQLSAGKYFSGLQTVLRRKSILCLTQLPDFRINMRPVW